MGSVEVSGTDADAFRLSWTAAEGAEGYVVNVWTNGVVGASDGVETLGERFSSVTNREYKTPWSISEINSLGDYRNWTGELIRGYKSAGDGDLETAVVLGSETASGWLLSAPLDVSGEAVVRLRLTRHTEDDTAPVQVAFVRNGETNFAATVSFGTAIHSFADYSVVASNLANGCQLLVASQKKPNGKSFGRVAVAEISVRSGVSSGERVRMPVVEDRFVAECAYACEGLSPALYGYSVVPQIGGRCDESDAVTGEVDMCDPPWLRCWRASGFLPKPCFRALDWSAMGKVASERTWQNGTDGDGLYAFSDSGADVCVRPYSTNATYLAIYQFVAGGGQVSTNALALLGTGSSGLSLVLPVRLDAVRMVTKLSVAYVLRQLPRKGFSADTELAFSWKTGDDIRAMEDAAKGWTADEAGGYVAAVGGEQCVSRRLEIPARELRGAKYLFLQWRVPKQANSAMIGLSDLVVSGALSKNGLLVMVK